MKPTLLVLAAGMGSRYGGIKQIDAVGKHGECLLDYSAFDAIRGGFGKIVFIIRKDIEADFRVRLFDRIAKNFNAEYIFQSKSDLLTEQEIAKTQNREKPWGTIHAVLCSKDAIKEPFAVINSDDYYGRSAFETLALHLSSINNDSTEHAMVGYILKNTMSEHGSVSRGLCSLREDFLCGIKEHTKISYTQEKKIVSEIDGKLENLTGEEKVSMNFFGFSPLAFQSFFEYWENFKKTSLNSAKAEALLPEAASEIIKKGQGTIRFFSSAENWFGMTYPQDRQIVKQKIEEKIRTNYYPERLWQKE